METENTTAEPYDLRHAAQTLREVASELADWADWVAASVDNAVDDDDMDELARVVDDSTNGAELAESVSACADNVSECANKVRETATQYMVEQRRFVA